MLLNLYHRLPPVLRDLAATARGYELRGWRYGPQTDRLVAEALDREHWSAAQWTAYQQERLATVLDYAARHVPYYRDQWAARRHQGDRAAWDMLDHWPILDKEPVRATPAAFVGDDHDPRRMFHEYTSGTTGKSLDLWHTRETIQSWYALFEARWHRWYGVTRQDRWALIAGQLVAPVEQSRPPFWVWNAAFHQLYMSSYHLRPDLIPTYLDALAKYKIAYLLGYTSSLVALAQEAVRWGYSTADFRIKVVITNAEPLYGYQREVITQAFGCPVRETYSMSEIVAAAGECQAGQMHLWPEVGLVEVFDDGQPCPPGVAGELICTSLLGPEMPLIRYRVGDRGALSAEDAQHSLCECGRTLPRLSAVEGRTDDVLYTPDGRRVGRLDTVFKDRMPVREAQIVQEHLDQVRVLYVPADDYTPAAGSFLTERLRARMGDVQVILNPVEQIQRTSNGKFRAVVCNVPPEELHRILAAHETRA